MCHAYKYHASYTMCHTLNAYTLYIIVLSGTSPVSQYKGRVTGLWWAQPLYTLAVPNLLTKTSRAYFSTCSTPSSSGVVRLHECTKNTLEHIIKRFHFTYNEALYTASIYLECTGQVCKLGYANASLYSSTAFPTARQMEK